MKIVLAKTAYSPLLKVAGDYSCGIFDVAGEMVAQGPDLPIHLGSMPRRGARPSSAPSRTLRARRRLHPQRPLLRRRLAPARRQRGHARLPRGPPAGLRLRARALARHRQRHARQLRRGHRDLRRGPAAAAGAAVSRTASPTRTSRRSSSPMSARPRSGSATCARRSRPICAASRACRSWRGSTARTELLEIMQEVMDYSERMMRAALAALPDGDAELRGRLRRRRRARGGRDRGRAPSGSACTVTKRGDTHRRRLRRLRPPGGRADERAADRHRLRRLLRAEDDRRSAPT